MELNHVLVRILIDGAITALSIIKIALVVSILFEAVSLLNLFPGRYSGATNLARKSDRFLELLLRPIRCISPAPRGMDTSPLVLWILISFAQRSIESLLHL